MKIRNFTVTLAALAGTAPVISAADFYVSPSGNDAASGTFSAPFKTIQKGIKTAQNGDTVHVRGGTYRELVEFGNGAGEGNSGVTLKAYEDETAIVSALDLVEPGQNGVGSWQQHSESIWKISLPESWPLSVGSNLVLVDGTPRQEARWPNVSTPFNFDYREMAYSDTGTVDTGSAGPLNLPAPIPTYPNHIYCNGSYTDSEFADLALPDDAWNGAMIDLNAGGGAHSSSGVVTASSGGTIHFRYKKDNNSDTGENEPYYLWNSLTALDSANEAFLDVLGVSGPPNTLYLFTNTGNPGLFHQVEVRTRRTAIVVKIASDITIEGLTSIGGEVDCRANSSGVTLSGLKARYGGSGLNRLLSRSALVTLRGSNHVLENSDIGVTFGGGVQTGGTAENPGSGTRLENNVIQRCGEFGIGTWNSEDLTIVRNTVSENGGFNIAIFSPGSIFSHNHCYLAGLRTADESSINANGTNRDMLQTVVSYNWVHDNVARTDLAKQINGGKGIRLDSSSGSAFNMRIHHNIVWNIRGKKALTLWALAPGDAGYDQSEIYAYNNTLSGNIKLQGNGTRSVKGHVLQNNIADRMEVGDLGDHDSADAVVDHNLFSNQGVGEDQWPGNLFESAGFIDAANGNYGLLESSPAIDAGVPIPPITDGFEGSAPDLGALEYRGPNARLWSAGARILPEDLAALRLEVAVDSSGTRKLHVVNIPTGRVLPDEFAVKLQETVSHHLRYAFSITTHRATGIVRFDEEVPNGVHPAFVSGDGGVTWIPVGQVAWDPVPPQDQITSEPEGGEMGILQINANLSKQKVIPVDIIRSTDGDLTLRPVPLVIDTRDLIASGEMHPEGNNIRFRDLAGTIELEYFIQSGINTASTVFWIRTKDGAPTEGKQIYLALEDLESEPASDDKVLFDRYYVLRDESLAVWFSANALAGTFGQDEAVTELRDQSAYGHHASQANPSLQPRFEAARSGGLATIRFDGDDYMEAGDLMELDGLTPLIPENERVSIIAVHRNEIGSDTEGRTVSSGIGGSEAMWAKAQGTVNEFVVTNLRRQGPNLRNFTLGKKANKEKKYFTGELAEALLWARELENSSPGPWELAKEYVERKYDLGDHVRAVLRPQDTLEPASLTLNGEPIEFSIDGEGNVQFVIPPVEEGTPLPAIFSMTVESGGEVFSFDEILKYDGPIVLPDPHYHLWATNVGLPEEQRNPNLDVEPDGLANLLEYSLDLSPQAVDRSALEAGLAKTEGEELLYQLTFRRNTNAPDIDLAIQASSDGSNWRAVAPESYQLDIIDPDPDGDGSAELVRVSLAVSKRIELFRLKVELVAP